MKRVHRALQLRHHKHTAKLLPHKHTSYGALFLLMCVPIAMLALVGHFVSASDYSVTASVLAQVPTGAPSIVSPVNGTTTDQDRVTVSGTCPVVSPAVIIAIYDGPLLLGSTMCSVEGTFSVQISLSYGAHTLVAKVVTITGQMGQSSNLVTITRADLDNNVNTDKPGSGTLLGVPFYVIPIDAFVVLDGKGQVVWKVKFTGGQAPYRASIDWGDGSHSDYTVSDSQEQAFVHTYDTAKTYEITLKATDGQGTELVYHTTAVTFYVSKHTLFDAPTNQLPPVVAFLQKNIVQIYIVTLSALVFLWYLEHGRHLTKKLSKQPVRVNNKKQRQRKI